MPCTLSQDKLFKILEWVLFIGLCIVSGWFASGVLDNFFSSETNFSQHKEKVTHYPVISFKFLRPTSQVNLSDVKIYYSTSPDGLNTYQYLKIGENHLYNNQFNKTEKIILENNENTWKVRGFKIIHVTPILKKNSPTVDIRIEYNVKHNASSITSDLVFFYITSRQNSPGRVRPIQFQYRLIYRFNR